MKTLGDVGHGSPYKYDPMNLAQTASQTQTRSGARSLLAEQKKMAQ